ncbi:hypothetical protein ACHAWF_000865 [Thalassiosira exigua]
MTSNYKGVELDCEYGDVLVRVLIRIWRLRLTYPLLYIILHASDVKSCFRQMKHHPDVRGAFSFIISKVLYLSCGLTFGVDFSPSTWQQVRRAIEQLATKLFEDKSLVTKHRKYLDQLKWSKRLNKKLPIMPAHETSRYPRVIGGDGNAENTPHYLFVDDDVYA